MAALAGATARRRGRSVPALARATSERYARTCRPSSRGGIAFEESPDITGQGGREPDPGKPAGKCHRNTPPMARQHVRRAQARVKRCGKSAPAPWRHGGQANPTRCKAKQDRLKAARRGPGRPLRWMVAHDRIRLTGLLRKSPAHAGLFYARRSAEGRCGAAESDPRGAGGPRSIGRGAATERSGAAGAGGGAIERAGGRGAIRLTRARPGPPPPRARLRGCVHAAPHVRACVEL